ncbi:MAG TPA: hypothetical protein VH393_04260 [Ktedonobacterales bacterium]|jgi:hypothetical protein
MISAPLTRAASADLILTIDGDDLVIDGPSDAEALALALLADERRVIAALTVLDLASRNWETAVIVGGRWADGGKFYDDDWRARHGCHRRKLLLGVVVGGSEERWREWVDRATLVRLEEAAALLRATERAA